MRIIIIVMALAGLILWLYFRPTGAQLQQWLKRAGLVLIAVAIIWLAATGRLHWLFALIAAALPLMGRLFRLIRYLPMLLKFKQWFGNRSAPAPDNTSSHVTTQFLSMSLDHQTGNIDGQIIAGEHAGSLLSSLDVERLMSLYQVYLEQDQESAALLESYLQRRAPDWREQYQQQQRAQPSETDINRAEALAILGLHGNPTADDIIDAHRRFMQKLHPDRGGSTWLAAKINQAREYLLRQHQ